MTECHECPYCGLKFTLYSDYLEHVRCYVLSKEQETIVIHISERRKLKPNAT